MKRNTRKDEPVSPSAGLQSAPSREPLAIQPNHPVLVAVSEHLHQHDVTHAVMSHGGGLLFAMANETVGWTNVVTVEEEKNVLRIAARLPLFVPPAKRKEVAAYLTQLNYGNLIGSWQMDGRHGEVIYASTHLFGSRVPEESDMNILIMITTGMMGKEGPKILRRMQRSPGKLVAATAAERN